MQHNPRFKAFDCFMAAFKRLDSRPVELGGGVVADSDGAVLVCTDVAARGLDIPNVQNILHY
jgi:hypothetical protein